MLSEVCACFSKSMSDSTSDDVGWFCLVFVTRRHVYLSTSQPLSEHSNCNLNTAQPLFGLEPFKKIAPSARRPLHILFWLILFFFSPGDEKAGGDAEVKINFGCPKLYKHRGNVLTLLYHIFFLLILFSCPRKMKRRAGTLK